MTTVIENSSLCSIAVLYPKRIPSKTIEDARGYYKDIIREQTTSHTFASFNTRCVV